MAMTDVGLTLDGVTKNMGNLWLADSGASCHMPFSEEGMYKCKDVQIPIIISNGLSMIAKKIGKKKVTMILDKILNFSPIFSLTLKVMVI
jgi:hypothetical protein